MSCLQQVLYLLAGFCVVLGIALVAIDNNAAAGAFCIGLAILCVVIAKK